jgi:pimeloyl-ACP methyl ester carboxylesterase
MSPEMVPRDQPISPADWSASDERRYAELQERLAEEHGVDVTSRMADASVGGIHYLEAGDPDGDPVLLLHGLSATGASWLPMVSALTDQYRVLMPDRPGRGLSVAPTYDGGDIRSFMSAYLVDLLDDLGIERPHVVGNSLGGLQAFLLALDHDRVDRLCLVGAPGGVSRDMPLPFRLLTVRGLNRVLTWLSTRNNSPESVREDLNDVGVTDDAALSELFCEMTYVSQELPGRRASLLSFADAAGSLRGMHPMYDLTDELPDIDCPTAFLWGTDDYFFDPEVGRPIADRMPDAEFHLLENHGHIPWLEPGDEVERTVRAFLDSE